MGPIFAKHILKKRQAEHRPDERRLRRAKGARPGQGDARAFNNSPLKESFIGNVEGRDIIKGGCDVIVTDGFVGNVVLKVCEGVFDFFMKMAGKELLGALNAEKRQGQAGPAEPGQALRLP